MANAETTKSALAATPQPTKAATIEGLMSRVDVKKRFEEILGKKAPGFVSSVVSATKANPKLLVADPRSVLSSAVIAATLDLPINSNLGFAHIVPYKGSAQFQMGWKGFVQLAIRSGQYQTMNAADVYADELEDWNPITGSFKLADKKSWKQRDAGETDKIIGYVAFFRTLNGFEKYLFMTKDQIKRHGKKFSKSFDSDAGQWTLNFAAMALKTVMKLLLSKYGILSIEMGRAVTVDQAVPTPGTDPLNPTLEYQDAVEGETVPDVAAEPPAPQAESETPPAVSTLTGKPIEFGK